MHAIDPALVVDVPSSLVRCAGVSSGLPKLPGAEGFVEFVDDEIVVRLVTRAYRFSAAQLLREVAGPGTTIADLHVDEWAATAPGIVASAECRVDEPGGGIVIALVVEAPKGDPRHRIGVELVAEGPEHALDERLHHLRHIAASVRTSRAA